MASGPWDNVTLAGPPNGPAWVQAAAQMMGATQGAINNAAQAYQGWQNFGNQQQLFPYQLAQAQKQQQLSNLFQNGVPTLPNGQTDYNSVIKSLLQAGGASEAGTAISAMPTMQKQQLIDSYTGGGGQPANPTAPAAGSPSQITGQQPNQQPRIPYGSDNSGAPSIQRLTAEIGGSDKDASDATMRRFAKAVGVSSIEDDLDPERAAKAKKIITAYFDRTSGSATPVRNPVAQSGTGDQEAASSNELKPSSGEGSSAMSPRQTGERRTAQAAAQPTQNVVAAGSAAAMVPPPFRENPQAFAEFLRQRADQLRQSTKGKIGDLLGVSSKRDEDEAKALDDRASKIEEALGKDVTAKRTPQIEADTKYYDSLHRGLTGTAMIAAQQKQNIDMLRQIAKSPDFTPGAGSDLALAYQRTMAQLGINPTGAAPREIFNQVATRILADQISGLKSMASETGETGARVFKQMIDLEEKANLTHENSLEGIKSQLDIIDRVGDLMMKWANKADDYKIKNGALDAGFDKQLRSDIAKARLPDIIPQKVQSNAPSKTQPGGWQEIAPGIRIREKPSVSAADRT